MPPFEIGITLPIIETPFGAKYFTKLDLWVSYNLILICLNVNLKIVFHTRCGHFKCTLMHFHSLKSTTNFSTNSHGYFWHFYDIFTVIHMDDTLPTSLSLLSPYYPTSTTSRHILHSLSHHPPSVQFSSHHVNLCLNPSFSLSSTSSSTLLDKGLGLLYPRFCMH